MSVFEVELDDERLTKLCRVAAYHETRPEAFLPASVREWIGVNHDTMGEPDDEYLVAQPVCGPCVAAFSLDIEGDDLTRLNALAAFFGETAEAHLRRRVPYWVELEYWMMEDQKDEAANPRWYGGGVALLSPTYQPEDLSQYPTVKGLKDGWRREKVTCLPEHP